MALLSRNKMGGFWTQDCRTLKLSEDTSLSDCRLTLRLRGTCMKVYPGKKDRKEDYTVLEMSLGI